MSNRLRVVAAVLLGLSLASGVAAAQRTDRHLHQKHFTFDLIAGIATDPFYVTMERGARHEARALGVTLISLGAPDAFSASAQIPYVNLAIAQHPDAILIAPTDKTALIAPLRRAVKAGIPVITVDTSVTAPIALTHIGSRNVLGGALAARALAQAVHSHGTVVGLSVRPGISSTDRRQQGFTQQLRLYPNIQYLGTRYDDDIVTRAARITSRELARHPAPDGIFAMNSVSGVGAISAIAAAHRSGQTRLVEFDTEPLQVYTLRRGMVDALIAQDPWTMGDLAVSIAYRWATGHRTGIKRGYSTQEVIITRANVDNPQLSRFLYVGQ